jgi:hypothetical protein
MKATVVGLVTPHVLKLIDIAKQAESGMNVDWHLRDAVARTLDDLGQQFNKRELLAAYIHGLQVAASDARPTRRVYIGKLREAAALAANDPRARE